MIVEFNFHNQRKLKINLIYCTFIAFFSFFIFYNLFICNSNSSLFTFQDDKELKYNHNRHISNMHKRYKSVADYDFFTNNEKFANHLLYQINDNILVLLKHLNEKYANTTNKRIKEGILRLNNNYHINKLIEHIPSLINSDTSYTINKGEVIAICLRHKENKEQFHDLNLITFVVIHELSHIFSIGYGHETEFWENFRFLLNESIICGIYVNIDYSKAPQYYCGLNVTYNPLFDKEIHDITIEAFANYRLPVSHFIDK